MGFWKIDILFFIMRIRIIGRYSELWKRLVPRKSNECDSTSLQYIVLVFFFSLYCNKINEKFFW